MGRIPVSNGGYAFVDDWCIPVVGKLFWHCYKGRHVRTSDRRTRDVCLNRFVYRLAHGPIPKGKAIVCVDGNYRNCRVSNLKAVDWSTVRRYYTRGYGSTGYKGISHRKDGGYQTSGPYENGVRRYIGYFHSLDDALKASEAAYPGYAMGDS